MPSWLRRFTYLLQQSRHDAELREEIEAHRAFRQAQLERQGLGASEAEIASRRALGNVLLAREDAREAWLGSWDTWLQDVRHGLRFFRRNPIVAAVVIITMAIGIGMNAAMFGVFHAVLLRPLPYPDPERLVWLAPRDQRFNNDTFMSRGDFVIWRERAKAFERMAAYGQVDVAFLASDRASEERITAISEDFWAITDARAVVGRLLGPEEANAVVLSYRTFERRFNADTGVLGSPVTLNGHPMTIVGVVGRDYRVVFPAMLGDDMSESAAYIALPAMPSEPGGWDRSLPGKPPVPPWVRVVGKLRPRADIARGRSELEGIFDQIARDFPTPLREGRTLRAVPLQHKIIGPASTGLTVLLVAVALVLMIATTNIAHIQLARSLSRQPEIALRVSLGAARTRIIRQLLSESLVLAAIGCVAGLAFAHWALGAIVHAWPQAVPRLEGATINAQVLTFALTATLLSTLVFGAAPALSLLGTDLVAALKREDKAVSPTRGVRRVRSLLVSLELALATALLIGAGLMLKSLWGMSAGPPGFDPAKTLVTRVSLSGSRYASRIPQEEYVQEVLRQLQAMPGVSAVGIDAGSFHFPIKVDGLGLEISGSAAPSEAFATFKPVSLGFLHAMAVPLVSGRWPTDAALSSASPESTDALLVNERFVQTVLGGRDPIGRHISGPYVSGTVAGVVADFKDRQLDAVPLPQVYVPFKRSMALKSVRIVLRTNGDPAGIARSVGDTIARIDRTQAIAEFATLDDILAASITNRRFSVTMLALFAGVALFLALTGAYGVVAHSVAQRTREMGIRIALGARPADVVGLVVRHEMAVAVAGIGLGVLGTFAVAPSMAGLLYDVAPRDPATFTAVAMALGFASLLTCWSAAARAARVDPIVVLRG